MAKISKLFKALLCASMLLTGFILNPVKANAEEEAGTYANPVQMWTGTEAEVVTIGSNSATVFMKFNYVKSQLDTSMAYVSNSSTCSMISSGTCTIKDKSVSGSSSLNSTNHLIITLTITTVVNGTSTTKNYKFVYYKNELEFKQLV